MGRSPCCEKAHTNKGAWTKEEDDRLVSYIRAHGEGCWRSLPKAAGLLRCGKSCRLRWINYLRPDLKRGNFSEEEDELIIKLHSLLGNKWSLIAGRLPGRTDNEIKNYWNTHIRRKLLNRGIDPATHRPITDPDVHQTSNIHPSTPNHNVAVNSSPEISTTTTTTISFATTSPPVTVTAKHHHLVKNEVQDFNISSSSEYSPEDRRKMNNTSPEKQERCPDLNLELRIGPPQQQAVGQTLMTGGRTSSNECSCTCTTSSLSGTSSNSSGYDFLGLKNVALDYRSLEMK
ncbi:hypothetical protein SSX86_028694 [Deinandra increscens subsp. villosa]|uniref:Uncharacterized protein n=1 Tax=Deinandra increscens subsp. villosa TaxID=3103831 RepID=A0AAP0GJW6_9ASTR